MCYTFNIQLQFAGFSISPEPLQRNRCLRDDYVRGVKLYQSNFMVFVDETGCGRSGYGLRGHREKSQKLLVRGCR